MRRYVTTHNNAAKREKWSKIEYDVNINADKSIFTCECGQFEHTRMLCSHVLRVGCHESLYIFINKKVGQSVARNNMSIVVHTGDGYPPPGRDP